jgi:hypothetical protein
MSSQGNVLLGSTILLALRCKGRVHESSKFRRTDVVCFSYCLLFTRDYYIRNFREILDYLVVQYCAIIKSMNDNLKSIGKVSPKYILNLSSDDAIVISEMAGIDDPQLLFKEIQLFAVDINEQCDTIRKAADFIVERKTVTARLYQAYSFLLTLPVTIASNERGFSKLKIIKNRLRSKMGDDRSQALLLCSIEIDLVDALTNEELIEKWLKNKCGRLI